MYPLLKNSWQLIMPIGIPLQCLLNNSGADGPDAYRLSDFVSFRFTVLWLYYKGRGNMLVMLAVNDKATYIVLK